MSETIDNLFFVKKGKGEYREKLEKGKTPLVSATNANNGIIDHVDLEPTFKAPAISVERVSGQAFVQLFDFATVPDDITVLIPREKMSLKKLFYIASQINIIKWRFSYSRKLNPPRIKPLQIDMSVFKDDELNLGYRFPQAHRPNAVMEHNHNYRLFNILELFPDIKKGDFHALDRLDEGNTPTVSRIEEDNGVTGYYEKPEKAKLYQKGLLTVSTVTGDAFVQLDDFIATDNVLILISKTQFKITTLFFIQLMLYLQKWRFSYGRQPYKRIFSRTEISLPIKDDGTVDEQYIERLVTNCYGWEIVEKRFTSSNTHT